MISELALCKLLLEYLNDFIEDTKENGYQGPYSPKIETFLQVLEYDTEFHDILPGNLLYKDMPYALKEFIEGKVKVLEETN